MRFRKRIKIAKGLYVNLSKSGASISAGTRGASVTVSKKGIYGNAGIPGTGIYSRQKIAGFSSQSVNEQSANYQDMSIKVSMAKDGQIDVWNESGQLITDESLLRKIKRTDKYKSELRSLYQKKYFELKIHNSKFVNIHETTPPLLNIEYWQKRLSELKYRNYEHKTFKTARPDIESVRKELTEKAKKEIKSILFWTNEKKRAKFVEKNFDSFYNEKIKEWEDKLEKHHKAQEENRLQIENFNRKIDKEKYKIELLLKCEPIYVAESINNLLEKITLPVDFSVDYNYEPDGSLYVDLDLPVIEDMQPIKGNLLKNGKLSINKKTAKEIKQDYTLCVCGLAFYFAGLFFNISPVINKIVISGYTKRLSSKTGNSEDIYIYSIILDRTTFGNITVKNINPVDAFNNFKHKIEITKTFEMKEIIPYEIGKTD